MQQKETERADDRIDEEFYEELSEEEIQDEIASLYRRRGYMDAETLCRIDREIRIAEQVLRRRLGGENDRREEYKTDAKLVYQKFLHSFAGYYFFILNIFK